MKKILVAIAMAAGATLLSPAPGDAQHCPPATKKIGEQSRQVGDVIIRQPVCQRMTAEEMKARVAELDARIERVRRELVRWRDVNLPGIRGDLEMWEELAGEARTDIYLSAGNLVLSSVLESKLMRAEAQRKLVGSHVDELKKLVMDPRYQVEGVPELRVLKKDLREAKQLVHVLETADRGREMAVKGAALGLSHDTRSRLMTLVLGAAYIGTKVVKVDPRVRLFFDGTEFASALLWGGTVLSVGREQVDQLSTVAGQQLEAVTSLTTVYRESFEERAVLREKLGIR